MATSDRATGKSQADGAFEFAVDPHEGRCHQIHVRPTTTFSTGYLTVSIRTPGSSVFAPVVGQMDLYGLSGGAVVKIFEAACNAIRITPNSIAAGKTYDVMLVNFDR